ncbi:MAG: hypothetical protein CBB76_07460 [Crocinitomicaceae bacterium TMED16]|mgnify:FL=1|nr:MAG: hypothetical protein CBB76_07460 [Crocinitomicaceae bacterium TMED16]|tara:strand:+ start:1971 stop:2384 length:414 start_codon:yes stop_codon:yes gene_type:complete
MIHKIKLFLFLFLLIITFSYCSKVEGPGGTITIKGKVVERDHVGVNIFEYPAVDQDVFIIYGNQNSFYDDDIKTSYDGSFEFRYLQKGDYQVFVYSDVNPADQTPDNPSSTTVVLEAVNVADNNEIYDMGTIYIDKY